MTTEKANSTQAKSSKTELESEVKFSHSCPSDGGYDWKVVLCTQCKKIWICLPLKTVEDLLSDPSDISTKIVLPAAPFAEPVTLPTISSTTFSDTKIST